MAIITQGKTWRTLEQPLFVNGRRVYEAYANGVKVYPENMPGGSWLVKFRGWNTINRSRLYQYGDNAGGFFLGGNERSFYKWIKEINQTHYAFHTGGYGSGVEHYSCGYQFAYAATAIGITVGGGITIKKSPPDRGSTYTASNLFTTDSNSSDPMPPRDWILKIRHSGAVHPMYDYFLKYDYLIDFDENVTTLRFLGICDFVVQVRAIKYQFPNQLTFWYNPTGSRLDTAVILRNSEGTMSLHDLKGSKRSTVKYNDDGVGIITESVFTGDFNDDNTIIISNGVYNIISGFRVSTEHTREIPVTKCMVTGSWPPQTAEQTSMPLTLHINPSASVKEIMFIGKNHKDTPEEHYRVDESDLKWG